MAEQIEHPRGNNHETPVPHHGDSRPGEITSGVLTDTPDGVQHIPDPNAPKPGDNLNQEAPTGAPNVQGQSGEEAVWEFQRQDGTTITHSDAEIAQIVANYDNLQTAFGRQSNEIGQLRKEREQLQSGIYPQMPNQGQYPQAMPGQPGYQQPNYGYPPGHSPANNPYGNPQITPNVTPQGQAPMPANTVEGRRQQAEQFNMPDITEDDLDDITKFNAKLKESFAAVSEQSAQRGYQMAKSEMALSEAQRTITTHPYLKTLQPHQAQAFMDAAVNLANAESAKLEALGLPGINSYDAAVRFYFDTTQQSHLNQDNGVNHNPMPQNGQSLLNNGQNMNGMNQASVNNTIKNFVRKINRQEAPVPGTAGGAVSQSDADKYMNMPRGSKQARDFVRDIEKDPVRYQQFKNDLNSKAS